MEIMLNVTASFFLAHTFAVNDSRSRPNSSFGRLSLDPIPNIIFILKPGRGSCGRSFNGGYVFDFLPSRADDRNSAIVMYCDAGFILFNAIGIAVCFKFMPLFMGGCAGADCKQN